MQLAPNLDFRAAHSLHGDLMAARGSPLALDASNVERIGGLCLQILIAAKQAWLAEGKDFTIEAPSQALLEGLRMMGAAGLVEAETAN